MMNIEDKVEALEVGHVHLKCEVREMKVVQAGLTEAVREIKSSLDVLNGQLTWMSKMIIGSIWAGIVIGCVKMFLM